MPPKKAAAKPADDAPKEEKPKKKAKEPKPGEEAAPAGDAPPAEGKKKGKGKKAEEEAPTTDAGADAHTADGKRKSKKGKSIFEPADSVNPFGDLPTAPPTEAPSAIDPNANPAHGKKGTRKSAFPAPAPMMAAPPSTMMMTGGGMGQPAMGGKPGWHRVSTRQWLRSFREYIGKFQNYPYKMVCGQFFFSFGYYPDIVPQDSLNKYNTIHPISTKRKSSVRSGQGPLSGFGPSLGHTDTETSMSLTSTTATTALSETTDSHMPPLDSTTLDEGKKSKKGKSFAFAEPDSATATAEDAAGKKKGGKKGGDGAELAAAAVGGAAGAAGAAGAVAAAGKGKGKKKDEGGAEAAPAAGEEGGKKGKGKKKDEAGAEAAPAAGEEGGKKGKGKTKPLSAVSGNISFDPAIYDLTTLTVMNLPAGADAAKLKTLFPGSTVTMEGTGASIKFKDAATAEPFFTKEVSIDGSPLVVSPKLKP